MKVEILNGEKDNVILISKYEKWRNWNYTKLYTF